MQSWMVIVPPLIVLACVFLTKRINSSLIAGIASAAFIAIPSQPLLALQLIASRSWNVISNNLLLYLFLFLIGALIVLMSATGGTYALTHAPSLSTLRSKRSVQRLSIFASFFLFMDDYLSNLTVGCVMRPLTDRFGIPRAKLAYLIHTFSTGLIMFVPLSSWVAVVTSSLAQAGVGISTADSTVNADPFVVYLHAIPYIFYGILMLLTAITIVERRLSFGLMGKHEAIANKTGNLFGGKEPLDSPESEACSAHGSLADLFVPLFSLIAFFSLAFLWTGGYSLFGGTKSFVETVTTNQKTLPALAIGATLALIASITYTIFTKKTNFSKLINILPKESAAMMLPAIIMVTLANILGQLMEYDLQTGSYIASLIATTMPLWLLPLTIFVVALLLTLILGSAWATMMLLIPIALPMVIQLSHLTTPAPLDAVTMLLPTLGALFSGAICGNQISPFADTTIMAATSAGCYVVDHLATQISYAIPAIAGACASFAVTGALVTHAYNHPLLGGFIAGLLVASSTLVLLHRTLSLTRKS